MNDDHLRFSLPPEDRAPETAPPVYSHEVTINAGEYDWSDEDEPEPDVSRVTTGSVPAIDPARTGKHLATQTEYPWRTAVLHAGSTMLATLLAVASILGDTRVQGFINTYVPGQAAGVIAFGVGCGVLAGLLSRIANLPAVAALRTKVGLGPIAKKNLTR